ncbi:DUF2927 domain-containing protein [Defluviimonas sp. WL0002]|uniref:DUF2927 domain-containing protein n=1 Tax=Albidovulum marisflavi TaxID=2984159 RepID=A0ABT2Z9Y8_9RHOB|nr:DUF2927 domain-containing protein [Defluviimonas sp. WL0002]MCV2867954.1 DUF2927 domain-containing protein [Defluviimonas sp. WL0002]
MKANEIEALFTRSADGYVFARWVRPIVPVVFGVDDATLKTVKGAIEAVVTLAGHRMAETDPDQGANLMIFFFRDWSELLEVPDLDRLVPGLPELVAQLEADGANQYRHFRFEQDGAIRACVAFVRMDRELSDLPAEVLALGLAAQIILLWSDRAFQARSPLAQVGENVILRPDVAGVIRAAYDPVLPAAARDPSHALRLTARIGV